MAKSYKGLVVFVITVLVSLLVLGSLFALFFLYNNTKQTATKQEDIPYISDYKPVKDESIDILVIGCEEIQLPPSFMIVFSYDAPSGIIYITPLPTNTAATVGIREDTLSGHYDYQGMQGGVGAVKNLLLTEIERYVRLDKVGVSNLVDFLGGIEYEITENAKIGEESFVQGKQLLDGRRTSALLFSKSKDELADITLQANLVQALMNQRFDESLANKYQNFVSAFFYNVETNLNQYDFALRKKGLCSRMELDCLVTQTKLLKGNYDETTMQFIPSEKSLNDIMSCLQGIDGIDKEE